jgi:hypothetical protein
MSPLWLRFMLMMGRFNYGERGILDITHTRLYTFSSLSGLLEQSGFVSVETRAVPAPFPFGVGDGSLGRALLKLNSFLIHISAMYARSYDPPLTL